MLNVCGNSCGHQKKELARDPEKVGLKARMKLETGQVTAPAFVC